jgi:hypothetical protein
MTAPQVAATALHALLDPAVDLDGEAHDTVLSALLDTTGDNESVPFIAPIALLVEALDQAGRADLLRSLDLCPLHECDAAICADDENPECATERTR